MDLSVDFKAFQYFKYTCPEDIWKMDMYTH